MVVKPDEADASRALALTGVWNSDTCYHAANNGHLEVLKWARENGCDWDPYTEKIAKEKWPTIFQ